MKEMTNMEYIYVGKIVNTHGIKGELRIKSDFDKKDIIFKTGFNLYIGEGYVKEEIVTYRRHKDFDMVTFKGYDNINQVLNYLKMNVYVKRDDLNLGHNDYVMQDLVGLDIYENGKKIGKVLEIVYNGSSKLLYIESSVNFYIPFVTEYVKKVDVGNKIIEVANTKGLII